MAFSPRANFALQQNAVPLVRELAVSNDGTEPLVDLRLEVSASGGLLAPWEFLCGANWITEPEVEVVVAPGLPKYAEYREVVVQRINGGETGEAVARSLGISRGAVGDA